MIRFALPVLTALAGPASAAEGLPSGLDVRLHEVLVDDIGHETWLRFFFLAPQIARDAGVMTFANVIEDFPFLCAEVALPYVAEHKLTGQLVVITLQDRPVVFGQADPDATQFIDAYRIDSGACIWEAF